jgi:hypothetical protein
MQTNGEGSERTGNVRKKDKLNKVYENNPKSVKAPLGASGSLV